MTGNDDSCLVDNNILLRAERSDDPRNQTIRYALTTLRLRGTRLCYTSQTLGEFWNVSTRPVANNGFGLSIRETDRIAHVIEREFVFLPDSPEVHERWREMLVTHEIKGVKVHDARLAASMYVHGITFSTLRKGRADRPVAVPPPGQSVPIINRFPEAPSNNA